MVGFIREPDTDKDSGPDQPKFKTPTNDSERFKFDFDSYLPEIDDFSLPPVESFIDFDAIKDWIEEMQDPDRQEADKVESEGGLGVESLLEKPDDSCLFDFVHDIKDPEKSGCLKVNHGGIDEHIMSSMDEVGGDTSMENSNGKIVNIKKAELGNIELCDDSRNGDIKTMQIDEKDGEKTESLGCSIEEGLEKVSLVGDAGALVVTGIKETSTSFSDNGSDDDNEEDEEEGKKEKNPCKIKREDTEQRVDAEEGEIMGSDSEKMVSDNDLNGDEEDADNNYVRDGEDFEVIDDDEDDDLPKGPIKSKNELEVLPPVPPVNVTLQPCHQILPVGVVSSVLGSQVIVEGSEKHNPLSEGSILWIADKRLPLGLVDEIFGPVKNPYYIVRYNSESEVPSGIQNGSLIGFVQEFADHVLNDKNLYQKGYDASGENDEEVDEVEFSDDEAEAEYRRMLKVSKRGNSNNNNNNNQGVGNKKKNKRNLKNRDKTWTKDQPSTHQGRTQPTPSPRPNQSNRSPIGPISPVGSNPFPQQAQPTGFPSNDFWSNGMPCQQQNMALPNGFQTNGVPWMQQNHPQAQQMPSMAPMQWQQQQQIPFTNPSIFDLCRVLGISSSPLGAVNFSPGSANSPYISNQGPIGMGSQGPCAQFPMLSGFQPNGPQVGQSSNSQPATSFPGNAGVYSRFNQGASSRGGRGRGGRFGGGRGGRPQSK